MRGRGETGVGVEGGGVGGGGHSANRATFGKHVQPHLPPPALRIQQHSERCHSDLAREHSGPLCHRISSKTEGGGGGVRIIQAAAVSYYFEDGRSRRSGRPAATPATGLGGR